MRLSLTIDDDVLAEARRIAASEGRSVDEIISDLARRGLEPTPLRVEAGFPVFDVRPDAPAFSSEEVARALAEGEASVNA